MDLLIDERISSVLQNGTNRNHRTVFAIIGKGAHVKIPQVHKLLAKASCNPILSIFWCHKGELVKSAGTKSKRKLGEAEDLIKSFVESYNVEFIGYREHNKILGQTIDMLILQNFDVLTPNLIATSIESVRGGGLIILLLDDFESIDKLTSMQVNTHDNTNFVPRYNRRLFRFLFNTSFTLFLSPELKVIESISPSCVKKTKPKPKIFSENKAIEEPFQLLLSITKTREQCSVLEELMKALEKAEKSVYSITASRGRGKSVALGLALSYAIKMRFGTIFITAPNLENIKELFTFIVVGLEALGYKKYSDFKIIYSFKGKKRLITKIEVMNNVSNQIGSKKQTVEYHDPYSEVTYQPDLFVIDEAAAIPLQLIKKFLYANLVFMATTTNGYEGTGRSYSIKLSEYLAKNIANYTALHLSESIRYSPNDLVEQWLNTVLLLDCKVSRVGKCPPPSLCKLFYVDKDTLFSCTNASEKFLNDLFSLFVASHYKNSPNDLQILSDSPLHEVFALIAFEENIPCIVGAIHVTFEGNCNKSLNKMGNLIPWLVSENHMDDAILEYYGMRIVRIAVHPDYLRMGYGTQALSQLLDFVGSLNVNANVMYGKSRVENNGVIDILTEDNKLETDNTGTIVINTNSTFQVKGTNGQTRSVEHCEVGEQQLDGKIDEDVRYACDENFVNINESNSKGPVVRGEKKQRTEDDSIRCKSCIIINKAQTGKIIFHDLSSITAAPLDWIGTSFGLNEDLLNFWIKSSFTPLCIKQTISITTGEHSIILAKPLSERAYNKISSYNRTFKVRLVNLLYLFRDFTPTLCLSLFSVGDSIGGNRPKYFLSTEELGRLKAFSKGMVDVRQIMDIIPTVSRLYFLNYLNVELSVLQKSLLIMIGLQYLELSCVAKRLNLQIFQVSSVLTRCFEELMQILTISE